MYCIQQPYGVFFFFFLQQHREESLETWGVGLVWEMYPLQVGLIRRLWVLWAFWALCSRPHILYSKI